MKSTSYLFWWVASVRVGTCEGMSVDIVAREMATTFMPSTKRAAIEGKLEHLSMLVVVGRANGFPAHSHGQD